MKRRRRLRAAANYDARFPTVEPYPAATCLPRASRPALAVAAAIAGGLSALLRIFPSPLRPFRLLLLLSAFLRFLRLSLTTFLLCVWLVALLLTARMLFRLALILIRLVLLRVCRDNRPKDRTSGGQWQFVRIVY